MAGIASELTRFYAHLLIRVKGPPRGRLGLKCAPAGEHSVLPDFKSSRKTVPLPVTGRVDRCWDVVPASSRQPVRPEITEVIVQRS